MHARLLVQHHQRDGGDRLRHRVDAGDEVALPRPLGLDVGVPGAVEKGELHVVSIATGSDELVEAIPGGKLQAMSWSGNGRKLAYSVNGATPEGIRVIDLDTGKRSISGVKFTGGSATLDPEYLLAAGIDGIHRIRLSDGHDDLVGAMPYAIRAGYSQSGNLLGILTVAPGEDEPPVADDDTPDCRGGSFALMVIERR